MKSNDWKDRLGVMYSTNPDFQYNTETKRKKKRSERKTTVAYRIG